VDQDEKQMVMTFILLEVRKIFFNSLNYI